MYVLTFAVEQKKHSNHTLSSSSDIKDLSAGQGRRNSADIKSYGEDPSSVILVPEVKGSSLVSTYWPPVLLQIGPRFATVFFLIAFLCPVYRVRLCVH